VLLLSSTRTRHSWTEADFEPEVASPSDGSFSTWRGGARFKQAYKAFRAMFPKTDTGVLHLMGALMVVSRQLFKWVWARRFMVCG
jgi:hypothetical protein